MKRLQTARANIPLPSKLNRNLCETDTKVPVKASAQYDGDTPMIASVAATTKKAGEIAGFLEPARGSATPATPRGSHAHAAGFLYATQSTSTLQSMTMLDTTQARAGGCSPKYSLNTLLNDAKSRGSSSHTPTRITCSVP